MNIHNFLPERLNFLHHIKNEDQWLEEMEKRSPDGELLELFHDTLAKAKDSLTPATYEKWSSRTFTYLSKTGKKRKEEHSEETDEQKIKKVKLQVERAPSSLKELVGGEEQILVELGKKFETMDLMKSYAPIEKA